LLRGLTNRYEAGTIRTLICTNVVFRNFYRGRHDRFGSLHTIMAQSPFIIPRLHTYPELTVATTSCQFFVHWHVLSSYPSCENPTSVGYSHEGRGAQSEYHHSLAGNRSRACVYDGYRVRPAHHSHCFLRFCARALLAVSKWIHNIHRLSDVDFLRHVERTFVKRINRIGPSPYGILLICLTEIRPSPNRSNCQGTFSILE